MRKVLRRTLLPEPARKLVLVLLLSNAVSAWLFVVRVITTGDYRYWYMLWNLFLGWLPLLFAALLVWRLRKQRWAKLWNVVLTLLWLGFLPNSFYLLTDLIHLQNTGEINLLFDIVLLFTFIFNGYIAGYMSVYLIHRELLKRRSYTWAHLAIALVFLACGFAIYLGRTLRWNTWDVLVNPAGLLFDVSDGIVNPLAHPQIVVTTGTFFILLCTTYAVLYQSIEVIRYARRR